MAKIKLISNKDILKLTENIEHRDCPFCDSTEITTVLNCRKKNYTDKQSIKLTSYVECEHCKSKSPIIESEIPYNEEQLENNDWLSELKTIEKNMVKLALDKYNIRDYDEVHILEDLEVKEIGNQIKNSILKNINKLKNVK
jgi:uncharacterized Zn ribbon protein